MAEPQRYAWRVLVGMLVVVISGCQMLGTPTDTEQDTAVQPTVPETAVVTPAPEVGAPETSTEIEKPDQEMEAPEPETPEPEKPKVDLTKREMTYMPLDISALFDASATAGEEGFDGWGNTYPADELPHGRISFNAGSPPGLTFKLPDFKTMEKNVVTAAGQTVKVASDNYCALFVLAAATNGAQQDKITLYYIGAKAEAMLKVSDWCGSPKFGEIQAASYARQSGGNEEAECKLYIQAIVLDPAKELSAVTLPLNKEIHVFAMTLAK